MRDVRSWVPKGDFRTRPEELESLISQLAEVAVPRALFAEILRRGLNGL
jgi:hypothetical protein